jgi:hypothetical protein
MRVLLPIAVLMLVFTQACDRTITYTENPEGEPQSCFECHSDQNTYLVSAEQQWLNSFHASGRVIQRGSSSTCAACHISEGFVQRSEGLDVTGNDNPTVIHCFTCHAPHSNGDFSLRWQEMATLENGTTFDLHAGNTCSACHIARRSVDDYVGSGDDPVTINSTHWGPHHSNQTDMLLGSNGYEYDGYDYEITPHRSATRDGCVDCHFRTTSNNVVGGHSFNMRGDALDEDGPTTLLNTAACEPCHGELDDFDYNGVQTEIAALMEELGVLLTNAGLLVDGHPNRGFETNADSAGALWNFIMAEDDRSVGVHNYKYYKGLLESAIEYMEGGSAPQPPTPLAQSPVSR